MATLNLNIFLGKVTKYFTIVESYWALRYYSLPLLVWVNAGKLEYIDLEVECNLKFFFKNCISPV